jgi:hypothetical protein
MTTHEREKLKELTYEYIGAEKGHSLLRVLVSMALDESVAYERLLAAVDQGLAVGDVDLAIRSVENLHRRDAASHQATVRLKELEAQLVRDYERLQVIQADRYRDTRRIRELEAKLETQPALDARHINYLEACLAVAKKERRLAMAQAQAWEDTAIQSAHNRDYYRKLVEKIGDMIGSLAYIADDGTLGDSVLCAKVPELVERALRRLEILETLVGSIRLHVPIHTPDPEASPTLKGGKP